MWYEVHEAFQKTSIACFCVFWIQYLLCVLASVPHCAVYRETVTSSRGRWRLLIYHCILTSVTCTSLCWTGCVCRGEAGGGRVQRGRGCVCVYNSVCVVSGGGGEECLVCADDDNMKGGEGWAQTDCASQNQTQTRFVSEFRPSLRHHMSVYRNKQASAASF